MRGGGWLFLSLADVAGDDLVHGVAGLADPLLAEGKVDRRGGLLPRDLLDLLAGHVAHEAGRDAVEPGRRLRSPRELPRLSVTPVAARQLRRLERGPGDEGLPAGAELVAPHGLFDHREGEVLGDHGDPLGAGVLLDAGLRPAAEVGVGDFPEAIPGISGPLHRDPGERLLLFDTALLRRAGLHDPPAG